MATAKRPGGEYGVNGQMVDSEGVAIDGASKPGPDTPPSEQPGAGGALAAEERIGVSIAKALGGKGAKAETEDDEDVVNLPTLDKLGRNLKKLKTHAEVEAMRKNDDRVGAQKMYDARIEELDEESKGTKK